MGRRKRLWPNGAAQFCSEHSRGRSAAQILHVGLLQPHTEVRPQKPYGLAVQVSLKQQLNASHLDNILDNI